MTFHIYILHLFPKYSKEFLILNPSQNKKREKVKKKLQHRRFPVNIAKFLRTAQFLRTASVAAFAATIAKADDVILILRSNGNTNHLAYIEV